MIGRTFVPRLGLRPGKGTLRLSASTIVPSGHYKPLPGQIGAPDGIATVPETFPVTLPLSYQAGPGTQAFTTVRHQPFDLTGLNESHQYIVAFLTLDGKVLGQGTIGNPRYSFGASLMVMSADADDKDQRGGAVQPMSWAAWANSTPPSPRSLHVMGEVLVPNPGVTVKLQRAVPQNFNPTILALDLLFQQGPGIWPQVVVPRNVDYVEAPYLEQHKEVSIVSGGQPIAKVEIEEVS